MGLFSNNKKPCPICGAATPRLLATKIEGTPICRDCDDKIDLPAGAADSMTLDAFRKYIAFYDENQPLREQFVTTDQFDAGFMRKDIFLDREHGLFKLDNKGESLAFPASCLKGFRILEDRMILFEGTGEGLRCYDNGVAERAYAMQGQIDRFQLDRQEFERMERMQRMMEDREREMRGKDDPPPPRRYIPEPRFDVPGPVREFTIELSLDHPYWPGFRQEIGGPDFDSTYPSVQDYLGEYQEKGNYLYALSCGLMALLNPDAGEIHVGPEGETPTPPTAAPAPAVDAISEIQKYKTLMDAGVITEEEYTAKKRQLMGI